MKSRLALGVVLIALVACALLLLRNARLGGHRVPVAGFADQEAERAAELEEAGPLELEEPPLSVEAPRSAAGTSAAAPTSPKTPLLAEIRGRLVFDGGEPAAGVMCEVHGWGANQELELKYGLPESWTDPAGETDPDGRFSIRFDPPRAFQFAMEAKAPGRAGVEWRWGEIEPGAVVDVGEVTLLVGGTLEGRIVDRSGSPVGGEDWLVYARSGGLRVRDGRDETQVIAEVDPVTGAYRAEDVMPGRVELQAHSHITNWIDGPPVTLASGETLTVDIVYEGPDNSRRITVRTFSDPFYVMSDPDPEHIKLHCPDGGIRTAEKIEGSSQSHSFDDLEDGVYALEIDDPRYRRWSAAAVRPGVSVDAHLEGCSAVVLEVVDANGRVVKDYSARVEFRNVDFSPSEFEVLPVFGLLDGMFPGDYTVRVKAGELLGAAEIDGLGAGETRALAVTVGSGVQVSGRVVYRDGVPVAGLDVLLLRPAEIDDSESSPILTKNSWSSDESRFRKVVDSVITDEQGHFRFAVGGVGSYVVHVTAGGAEASSGVLELSNEGNDGVVLVLPRGGFVRGTLRGPAGEPCSGLRVAIEPESGSETEDPLDRMRRLESVTGGIAAVAADGRFELGPVPAGTATVYLLLSERKRGLGGFSLGDMGSNRIELGKVTVEEGAVVVRDFEVLELPGSIVLEVTVNGEPAAGLRLELTGAGESGFELDGETDAGGLFGPTPAFASTWTVEAYSPEHGWWYSSPAPIVVMPSAETRAAIAIDVATTKVLFVDKETGKPLANRPIALTEDGAAFPFGLSRKTDSEGKVNLTLTPGSYRFVLDPGEFPFFEPSPDQRTATLTWTAQGPLADRVEL